MEWLKIFVLGLMDKILKKNFPLVSSVFRGFLNMLKPLRDVLKASIQSVKNLAKNWLKPIS